MAEPIVDAVRLEVTSKATLTRLSQMLGDVLVKFNQPNQLQRQSFLFTTVG